MMAYIKGRDRQQYTMFPECIDDYVESDSSVRLFDAFVDSLSMDELGFVRSTPKEEGRSGYDPRNLLRIGRKSKDRRVKEDQFTQKENPP